MILLSCDDDEKIKIGDNHVSVGLNTYMVTNAIITQSISIPNVSILGLRQPLLGLQLMGNVRLWKEKSFNLHLKFLNLIQLCWLGYIQ